MPSSPTARARSPRCTPRGVRFCWCRPARSRPACSAWDGPPDRTPCTTCKPRPPWARWAWRRPTKPPFSKHGLKAAQILLTHEDLADRTRYLNARSTLNALLDLGVVPIINENDTVVTDEIKFGDNDTLGALVANLVEGEALVILTDQKGLYSADPRIDPAASLIGEGRADDRRYEAMAGGAGSGISKGGMITKIRAAQRAAKSGAHTLIVSGRELDSLLAAAHGEAIGTLLYAVESPLAARKQWLADHLQLAGSLTLDAGAVLALAGGRSLLAVGVKAWKEISSAVRQLRVAPGRP
jgi:glutamate 5-kinase